MTANPKIELAERLHDAYSNWRAHIPKYKPSISNNPIRLEQVCKSYSVWHVIIDIKRSKQFRNQDIVDAVIAYDLKRPKVSSVHSLLNTVRRIEEVGLLEYLKPKHKKNNQKRTAFQEDLCVKLYSLPVKLTYVQVHEKVNFESKKKGFPEISLSTVKQIIKPYLTAIEEKRYGASYFRNNGLRKGKFKKVPFALDRVECDATKLYFLYYDGATQKVRMLFVCIIIDVHSNVILGHSFGVSENGKLYIEALRNAFSEKRVLPKLLVFDQFPGNKSQEISNFFDLVRKLGVQIHIDRSANPQVKGTVERIIRQLNTDAKTYRGFGGGNITTKHKDSRVSPEHAARIFRKPMTREEVEALTSELILEYNSRCRKGNSLTRHERFSVSEKPNKIGFNEEDRIRLFFDKREATIRNGQISFYRDFDRQFYNLPSVKHHHIYNNRKVTIRYNPYGIGEDQIFVFDLRTDEYLFECTPGEVGNGYIDTIENKEYRSSLIAYNKEFKEYGRKQLIDLEERAREELVSLEIVDTPFHNHLTASKEAMVAQKMHTLISGENSKSLPTKTVKEVASMNSSNLNNKKQDRLSGFNKPLPLEGDYEIGCDPV